MVPSQYLVWGLSGLSELPVGKARRLGRVEVNMLGSIVPRVIRISQDCQKGVTEHNGPPPIASNVMARTLVRTHTYGLGDVEVFQGHMAIT